MVKLITVACVSFILLTGCISNQPRVDVHEVSVVTTTEITPPPEDAWITPDLPIHNLTKDSSDADVAKAYATSVKILQQWGEKLRTYLEAYKHD